jgi:hypothetical protein
VIWILGLLILFVLAGAAALIAYGIVLLARFIGRALGLMAAIESELQRERGFEVRDRIRREHHRRYARQRATPNAVRLGASTRGNA